VGEPVTHVKTIFGLRGRSPGLNLASRGALDRIGGLRARIGLAEYLCDGFAAHPRLTEDSGRDGGVGISERRWGSRLTSLQVCDTWGQRLFPPKKPAGG
jgi:hypothetical protein